MTQDVSKKPIKEEVNAVWDMIQADLDVYAEVHGGAPFGLSEVKDDAAFARWFYQEWQGMRIPIPEGQTPDEVTQRLSNAQRQRMSMITADGTPEGMPVAIEVKGQGDAWVWCLMQPEVRTMFGGKAKNWVDRYNRLSSDYGLPPVVMEGE